MSKAHGEYEKALITYETVIGSKPGLLIDPPKVKGLPLNRDDLIQNAQDSSPAVLGAAYAVQQAKSAVDVQLSGFMPSVDAKGTVSRSLRDPTRQIFTNTGQATLSMTIPFDTNGAVSASSRQAAQVQAQKRYELEQARKKSREEATQAWEDHETAKKQIKQFEKGIAFARISRDGFVAQADVGEATILQVLDAQQKLIQAQTGLEEAKENLVVSSYQMLAAKGEATACGLSLPVERYDIQGNYLHAKNKWFGTSLKD